MVRSAGQIYDFLVQKPKDDRRLALVSDRGIRAIILLNLITWVAKLTKLVPAHRVDEATAGQEQDVTLATGHPIDKSRLQGRLTKFADVALS